MKTLITSLLALTALTAGAQAQITYTGGAFTENFNALPSTGTTALNASVGTVNSLTGTEFKGTKTSGTGTTFSFVADNGASNSGALYSYGATGSTDRALGTLASGGAIPAFGLQINIGGADSYISFTLSLTREQWRSSTTDANTVVFEYALGGGAINSANFLTAPGFTPFPALNLVGNNVVATNGPLDGNANGIPLTGTLPAAADPGQVLFIRYTDVNETGNDAGLAIDNFSLVGNVAPIPEPSTYAMIGGGLGLLVFAQRARRRSVRV